MTPKRRSHMDRFRLPGLWTLVLLLLLAGCTSRPVVPTAAESKPSKEKETHQVQTRQDLAAKESTGKPEEKVEVTTLAPSSLAPSSLLSSENEPDLDKPNTRGIPMAAAEGGLMKRGLNLDQLWPPSEP